MARVVFLLVPGFHLLDLAGPAQVFATAADFGVDYTLHYLAEQPEVSAAQGLPVRTGTTWPTLTADDLVIVPGWRAPRLAGTARLTEASLRRLVEHHAAHGTVASVCSGADALGRAGLLDGRRCTIHYELQDELASRHPRAIVVPDVLYVSDDRVVTSAGIASGIDLALYLIATRHGPAVAAGVARAMIVPVRRHGDERQASAVLRHRAHPDDVVHRVQDLIDARFTERLPLAELARAAGCGERTLTRLFVQATGMTPLRYQQALRVERVEHLVGHGATVDAAARAVGFADARMVRRLRGRART
ncbi:GlxA family transcriptional regulator [Goodfellowiella coeruleoviolacea]|uniref:Transcriptional regulator GlxA family, contains an amidase domain and an AraC-type DNA-binding HTH domain n=1 Tax=Goodfellowiella coeruleoviolacea TaxID=334858 RepID=A0AAE3GD84_9PSEU|nr:DJ-1/PfpI family protein [Goodfellowiella coeruleoviolacea]MCP2165102.1 Transcriptional regulator GlxA family, contains an amidase domain and an AraC-type DNA-binding HTH domain [Goodfellowiella coeruleoviolacea]